MKARYWALLAALFVQILYGLNYTFAKDVMVGGFIKPSGFIVLRVGGASILFWVFSFLGPTEKIEKKDILTLVYAAFFGVATNMLLFFKGLELTTPIHASVIMIISPIIVLLLSSFYLEEKITKIKILGVIFGFAGAAILTVYGKSASPGDNVFLGNIMILLNAISYSIYIIIIKKLTYRYHPFTFIRWLFLIGFFMVLPFGFNDILAINTVTFTPYIWFSVVFVIVGATFGTYLLNPLALRHLKASTVTVFIYLQPLIAGIYAVIAGSDAVTAVKLTASSLIFFGVYLVTKKPKALNA
ncbi:DMT family transporter [Olleya namhaensis]|uniref:Threonine/homoserine efflux transporter RhtA n=1 Tax=Olleya namhaensis TaxID=1144750 RepID=A0A1I3J542_9FLAO|nr:DMT family transporter [Olleya namhaensis]SFI55299.1 Threonine/homoserine efflux transporter RhtA [Olleya namhaensis]